MKTSIIKSILALSILAILSGCADDPVVTSQTTTSSRRVMAEPAPVETTSVTTMAQPTTVRQTRSTTSTTAY